MIGFRTAGLFLAGGLLALSGLGEAQIMSIDLGHEFFKVALMRQGVPLEIVLNPHSKRKTPTAVSFMDAIRAFGDDALQHQGKGPSKVPMFFHSFMGKNFTSASDVAPGGEWWKAFGLGDKFYSYDVTYEEERGVPTFQFRGENATYKEEALASIIYFARTLAEESADGKKVKDLVITVPADASLRQRQALVAAGEIAGCRVLTLVHENAAFAVQRAVDFQPDKDKSEIVLFYNMGSRKTEASIVRFESRQAGMVAGKTAPVVTVLGSSTDTRIGGHLMDLKIAEVMLKEFQEKFPKLADGIAKNPRALRKLLTQAQKSKLVLSSNKAAGFTVESLYEDTDFQTTITREKFETMCKDMFDVMMEPIEKALEAANLTAADISMVEVIGGAWRVPKVQQLISEYLESKKGTKLQLGQHLNGEEAGALGAALVGANSSSSFRVKKIFFTDVTQHEYSVQVVSLTGEWEKNVTTLYPVGAPLGGKKKLAFQLTEDFAIRLFENGVLVAEYVCTGLADIMKEKWGEYNTTEKPKLSVSVVLEHSGLIEVKAPVASIEELYWVNVTKTKAKGDKNGTNATENATEKTEDEAKEGDAEKKEDEAENKTEGENATEEEEAEVTMKQKKKKHEKKLVVKRMDFKPKPLTAEQIAEGKARLETMAQHEADVAAVTEFKNELEAAIYGSREKLEREDIMKVSTEEQREEVSKACTESEEWMMEEGHYSKGDYESRLQKIRDLLGPMEERATELEAREDLPDRIKEMVEDAKSMQAFIEKNMSWVNENKTKKATEDLTAFEEWWAKKQEQQAALPLSEAPAYTKEEAMEKVNKVYKELDKLKKTKKPKEKTEKKGKKNATEGKGDKKDDEAPMPETLEATDKELEEIKAKKAAAVEKEDFDAAHALKTREKALNEHKSRLETAKNEL
eukprot:TRINITY_DN90912_c0_g1_i1.p1 TRINITY_DN90912_c0_g1~~TRINITY_DN90912_c0_g1_i1.p1  ORF type:complete len:915 (-),score=410.13 TRINITY_DN90912_c0_g1_i1:381-3125(-)